MDGLDELLHGPSAAAAPPPPTQPDATAPPAPPAPPVQPAPSSALPLPLSAPSSVDFPGIPVEVQQQMWQYMSQAMAQVCAGGRLPAAPPVPAPPVIPPAAAMLHNLPARTSSFSRGTGSATFPRASPPTTDNCSTAQEIVRREDPVSTTPPTPQIVSTLNTRRLEHELQEARLEAAEAKLKAQEAAKALKAEKKKTAELQAEVAALKAERDKAREKQKQQKHVYHALVDRTRAFATSLLEDLPDAGSAAAPPPTTGKRSAPSPAAADAGGAKKQAPRRPSASASAPPASSADPPSAAGNGAAGGRSKSAAPWPSQSNGSHRQVLCTWNEDPAAPTCVLFERLDNLAFGKSHQKYAHPDATKEEWNQRQQRAYNRKPNQK